MNAELERALDELIWDYESAEWLCTELRAAGFAIVPVKPTPAMLEAAQEDALAENASGVWSSMIKAVDEVTL